MESSNEIILYHYSFSPYARRVVWYLNLRQIPYTQCVQPFTLPRPDLRALGVSYRRIPLLSINRDIYLDSRHILATLERLYPPSAAHPSISPSTPEAKLISKLLESWTSEGGIFRRAAALIPNDSSAMQDPRFAKDREDFSGQKWDLQAMDRGRPEGLVGIWEACVMLENTILGDGRIWIGGEGTKGPGLVDIEATWPFHWLATLTGSLPDDLISAKQFPMLFSYLSRFNDAVKAARVSNKRKSLSGEQVLSLISSSVSSFEGDSGVWDGEKAINSGLKEGVEVLIWPIETGFNHKDRGVLVKLDGNEVVIERSLEKGEGKIRIHAPRHGFRISKIDESKL